MACSQVCIATSVCLIEQLKSIQSIIHFFITIQYISVYVLANIFF